MAVATITLTSGEDNQVNVEICFNPPVKDEQATDLPTCHIMAIGMLESVADQLRHRDDGETA